MQTERQKLRQKQKKEKNSLLTMEAFNVDLLTLT